MGLGGNPGHLKSLESALTQHLEKGALVHVSKSNSGFKTMDGAAIGANRVVEELLELLIRLSASGARVVKLSLVGYSFGGLIARYAIGILYNMGFFETVEPCIFATFATPHAGSVFPYPELRFRVLNFLGARMLGLTGKDLFLVNNVLEDLANPSLDYFKGLELFKHHILFANAVYDRTVPFWTSYLTSKSPFKDPKHMELKFYNHLHDAAAEAQTQAGRVPFLVNMHDSRYKKDAEEPSSTLTSSEKRQRWFFLSFFPFFVPILLAILTVGTLHSHIKFGAIYRKLDFKHPRLFETFKESLTAGTSSSQDRDFERKLNEDLASLAGSAIGNMLADTQEHGYENIRPHQITAGEPRASTSSDYGLADESPWDLEIPWKSHRILENLNTIKWNKYVVKLLHLNAHGEIVDRRRAKAQGSELMKFFARLAGNLLAADAKEHLS